MNYKALTVGAVLGFVLSLSPACEGGSGTKCDASSCPAGCCDPTGACIGITAMTASQCGTQGQNCSTCAVGTVCASGICAEDPAGIDSGCRARCPLGCCSGEDCLPGRSNASCGT